MIPCYFVRILTDLSAYIYNREQYRCGIASPALRPHLILMGELGALLFYRIMTRLKRILDIAYEIISTAVITIGVLLAVLYLCGIRLYHVKSGSMGELLPVGCVCFVSTYSSYESIEAGDVISFRVDDDMLVTHRAVRITDDGIYTKGDANNTEDPDAVTKENYIGKTVFALPYIGALFGYFRTMAGKAVIVAAMLVLLILGRIYRENNTEKGT